MRLLRLFKRDLAKEVSGWVDDGLIERGQGEAILARYGARLEHAQGGHFGYYMLSALAALFIGLALILIVSHNWDELPRMARMLGVAGVTLAINLQAMRLLLRNRYHAGVLGLFLGSIGYGVSIMLIAQIYHLGEHYPDGIFYWALGILPLVFITRSRLIALLMLGLAILWMLVEAETQFFPASFPLFALAALWLAYVHKRSALLFLGGVASLVLWLNLLLAWNASEGYGFEGFADQFPITLALGLILGGSAWWLMRRPEPVLQVYGRLLHLWLLRAAIILLLFLSFATAWDGLMGEHYRLGAFIALPLILGTLGGAWLARMSGWSAAGPLLAHGVFFSLAFLLIGLGWGHAAGLAVGANLLLLVSGIWLIRRGIDNGETHLFYTGVGVLLLTALMRYIDLIGDYLGGALLFTVAAVVLVGAARYWRLRTQSQEADHA